LKVTAGRGHQALLKRKATSKVPCISKKEEAGVNGVQREKRMKGKNDPAQTGWGGKTRPGGSSPV